MNQILPISRSSRVPTSHRLFSQVRTYFRYGVPRESDEVDVKRPKPSSFKSFDVPAEKKKKLPLNSPLRWDNTNQKDFLESLSKKLSINSFEDWYQVTTKDIRKHPGGHGVLKAHGGCIVTLMKSNFPDHKWKSYRFKRISPGYWDVIDNRREMFNLMAEDLGFTHWEDWYSVTAKQLISLGAGGLFNRYQHSLSQALRSSFPELDWKDYKFTVAPSGYWMDSKNQRSFLDQLKPKLKILQHEDWYSVTHELIVYNGGRGLLEQYGNAHMDAIAAVYPEFKFDTLKWKLSNYSGTSKPEQLLFLHLREIFPDFIVHSKYLHPFMVFPDSKDAMELDIYIPAHSLAFEYQGKTHFISGSKETWMQSPSTEKRDQFKREECKKEGITLIEVPYWWDGSKEAILATIHKYRPDVEPNPQPAKFKPIGVVRVV